MNQYTTSDNEKRVTRRAAQKAFDAGQTVRILPCKARPDHHMWTNAFYAKKEGPNSVSNFGQFCNGVQYYNCNNEVGRYLSYYVKQ